MYSLVQPRAAIRDTFRVAADSAGDLPPLPGVFPDQLAPVVVIGSGGARELTTMRLGFPPPPGVDGNRPVFNIRNPASAFWRLWLGESHRCLVPADMFCEFSPPPSPGQPAVPHRFALSEARPLFAFAGLWRPWTGTRGPRTNPATGEHRLYAYLTCPPNAVVAPHHPKAMPAMLTTEAEFDTWLHAPAAEALALQRPLRPELMREIDWTQPGAEAPVQQSLF